MSGDVRAGGAAGKVVVARRCPWWQIFAMQRSWGSILFLCTGPLVVYWAVNWYLAQFRAHEKLFDNEHFGGSVVFAVIALVGLLITGGLVYFFYSSLRSWVLDCACPVCGARDRRDFDQPASKYRQAAPCDHCAAYLRADGLQVSEEPDEATRSYTVEADRYLRAVADPGRVAASLAMPPICAVCGARPATQRRDIEQWGKDHSPHNGMAAYLIKDAVFGGTAFDPNYYHRGKQLAKAYSPPDPKTDQVRKLTVPVCEEHRDVPWYAAPLEYKDTDLVFHSYRFYKAFCALNRLYDAPPPVRSAGAG